MALIATTPPLRRLDSASTTTLPLGAKVIAQSSGTGGLASSLPTQVAPSLTAAARCASPRVTTYTSHLHTCVWLRFCSVNDSVGATLLDVSICSTQRNLGDAEAHPREKDKGARSEEHTSE